MMNLNRSKELAPYCGYPHAILSMQKITVFYDGCFYSCGHYVKILETVQSNKTMYTLYLRCIDGSNTYIDLFLYGKGFLALGSVQTRPSQTVATFVGELVRFINLLRKSTEGIFSEDISIIRYHWLVKGYYFHKSIFKFILTTYKSKYSLWIPPYTGLPHHAARVG